MKWISTIKNPQQLYCEIDREEPKTLFGNKKMGWYHLYVSMSDGKNWDNQYDKLEAAMDSALKNFHIPLNSWQQVK